MCYPKPGPRCSKSARKQLTKLTADLKANPNDGVLREKVKKARDEFLTSPAGIAALRSEGKTMEAAIAQARRDAQIEAVKYMEQRDRERVAEVAASHVPSFVGKMKAKWEEATRLAKAWLNGDLDMARAKSDNPKTRLAVAVNFPAGDVQTLLAKDPDPAVRQAIAERSSHPETLASLATDTDPEVRASVAANRSTPVESVAALVKDTDPKVQEGLAYNDKTPVDTLREFAKTGTDEQKFGLASNPATPADVLTRMYQGNISWRKGGNQASVTRVNQRLAHNENTPTDVLEALKKYKDKDTQLGAKYTLKDRAYQARLATKRAKAAEAKAV